MEKINEIETVEKFSLQSYMFIIFNFITYFRYPYEDSFWPSWLSWRRTSFQSLSFSESKLLNYVRNKCELLFIPISNNTQYLRTLIASKFENNSKTLYEKKIPIVMVHGFCSGIGLWCKNIDSISNNRLLYAMDLLGFGFSSRPKFPDDPSQVEALFTESIEEWRKKLGLNKFILLGHSLGGFIACAYAMKYPHNVSHLILVDPWGFSQVDQNKLSAIKKRFLYRFFLHIFSYFSPLSIVRVAGPLGPSLIKVRKDLGYYFQGDENLGESQLRFSIDQNDVYDYIYHCNAQNPSGELAFKTLTSSVIWAYYPMIDRIDDLDKSIPVSFIYGSETWMDKTSGYQLRDKRENVDIHVIKQCGHHVYAECSDEFNEKINEICENVDKKEFTLPDGSKN